MNLKECRDKIDLIDAEILRLMNARAELSVKIGAIKCSAGISVEDRVREREVLQRIAAANHGPLENDAVINIYESILRSSRAVQARTAEIILEEPTAR